MSSPDNPFGSMSSPDNPFGARGASARSTLVSTHVPSTLVSTHVPSTPDTMVGTGSLTSQPGNSRTARNTSALGTFALGWPDQPRQGDPAVLDAVDLGTSVAMMSHVHVPQPREGGVLVQGDQSQEMPGGSDASVVITYIKVSSGCVYNADNIVFYIYNCWYINFFIIYIYIYYMHV